MRIGAFELIDELPSFQDLHVISMLRPWIDVGNVGTITLNKLEKHFGANELGRLARPGTFFDFSRYRPIARTIEGERSLSVPNSIINYAIRDDGPDLLFFHILEPQSFGEDYTDAILEVLDYLKITRYIRIGGMYDAVPHTRPILVTGSAQGSLKDDLKDLIDLKSSTYQGPTSIVNLVSDGINERGIDNISLMAHLPQYVQLEEDYAGVSSLLKILCKIYTLPPDLADPKRGRQQYQELNTEIQRNQGLKALIQRLEMHYDSKTSFDGGDSGAKLSPQVEKFLREMGERFDNN
jgi:predicted ATP-grasp superfamily ATP-dependent carboligase